MPSDSSDKINLAVTVLLGFFFVQGIIASLVPKTDAAPLLAHYILFALLLSALNLAFSSAVFRIDNLSEDIPIPNWMDFLVFRIVSRLVCVGSFSRLKKQIDRNGAKFFRTPTLNMSSENNVGKENLEEIALKEVEQGNIVQVDGLKTREENDNEHNWKNFAKILDKFCSAFYLLASLVIVIIFIAPLIFEREPCK